MASSLLDRVKRPPQSAETFIAAADAPEKESPASTAAAPPPQSNVMTASMSEAAPENATPAPIVKARPAPRVGRAAGEDPRKHEVPRYTFNLRLNDYELELLRAIAEEKRDSMQKIVKNGLIPYLEELRKSLK